MSFRIKNPYLCVRDFILRKPNRLKMEIDVTKLQYHRLTIYGSTYMILNPRTWEELSYGLHNNLLTCNDCTIVEDDLVKHMLNNLN
jgi:hypothetical protein